jgi:hypothetical protein
VTFALFKAKAGRIEVEPQKIFYKAGGPLAGAMIIPEDTEWRESGITNGGLVGFSRRENTMNLAAGRTRRKA